MSQLKRLGLNSLGVPGDEANGPPHVAGFIALVAGEEELTGEEFMDGCALVGGGGDHGLEVGDGDGDEVAVEAEDDPAQINRVGAEDGLLGGPAEVGGAEVEVHEYAVGDGGVRRRHGGGGGGGREDE